jgi:hypothetical protein
MNDLQNIITDLEDLEQDYRLRDESMSNPYIQKNLYNILKLENDAVKVKLKSKADYLCTLINAL